MEGGLVKRVSSDKDESIGSKRGRDAQDNKGNMGRLEKRPSGMVIIDQEYGYSGDEMINGVKYEEEKTPTPNSGVSGGLFNQFITNLVNNSPRSNNHHPGTDFFEGELEKNGGLDSGEVGGEVVVKDGASDGKSGEVVENNGGDGDGDGGEVGKNEKDGGDIIGSIVAKLPRTLSGIIIFIFRILITANSPDYYG